MGRSEGDGRGWEASRRWRRLSRIIAKRSRRFCNFATSRASRKCILAVARTARWSILYQPFGARAHPEYVTRNLIGFREVEGRESSSRKYIARATNPHEHACEAHVQKSILFVIIKKKRNKREVWGLELSYTIPLNRLHPSEVLTQHTN